jgi:hypothetical protein
MAKPKAAYTYCISGVLGECKKFAKSIAAIPAESIPFIGVAVLIADTGYEPYAACATVMESDQLYSDLGDGG